MDETSTTLHTHTYDVNTHDECGPKIRRLKFEGYSLKGRVDLTGIQKATGEAMWPCCALLADYLNCYEVFDNKMEGQRSCQILELGCGLGLAGTVASVRAGRLGSVLMTDGDAGVVKRAEQISMTNYVEGKDAKVSHDILWWGDVDKMQKIKEGTIDGQGFDMIVASDVIYDSNAFETAKNFAATIQYLLRKDFESTTAPKCLVAFQQRSVDINVLYEAFDKVGFDFSVPEGDYYEDIFGERNDCRTCFTDKFLLSFERRPMNKELGVTETLLIT